MDKLNVFNALNNRQFASAVRFFTSDKRAELVAKFWDFVANAILRCYQTGDSTHVNKAAAAAEICGYGPAFRKAAVAVIPFKYDMASRQFVDKIQREKRRALHVVDEKGVLAWETQLRDRIDDISNPKTKTKPQFDGKALERGAKRLVHKAIEAGLPASAIKKAVSEAISNEITTVKDSRKQAV